MKNLYKNIILLPISLCIGLSVMAQNNNAFRFKISGNNYSDETVIRMVNSATQNFDGMYDAWKLFSPNPNVPSIYTQISPGQELSINSLPEFTEDVSVTIFTHIPANGIYTLNFEEIFPLTPNYKISLTDITTTTHYRLLGDTALVFTFNTQQSSPSFTFNISTAIVSSISDETCNGMDDGELVINNAGNTDWDISILDGNNNIVYSSNSTTSLNNFGNLNPGNYSAEISSKGIVEEVIFSISPAVTLTANFNLSTDTVYLSNGGNIHLTNTSQNAQSYSWDFGDGGASIDTNPTHTYNTVGNYNINLSALTPNCITQVTQQLIVLSAPAVVTTVTSSKTAPIELATLGNGNFQLSLANNAEKQISVYDITGKIVFKTVTNSNSYSLSLANHSTGLYILNVVTNNGALFQEKIYR